ncbi:MAG: hypothetical protein WD492_12950 [Alkalispirochaeta sp.]
MSSWPATLPQKFDQESFSERPQNNTVRANTSMGPGKVRRRFTAAYISMSGSMLMTPSQVSEFKSFYHTVTKGGSEAFDWQHPLDGSAISARFSGPYEVLDSESGDVLVTFSVEVIP